METKKPLNKGQQALIERNKQRIAAMPAATCPICGAVRKRKNKYCNRCWDDVRQVNLGLLKKEVPSYAYCAKSPTHAHEWVLNMQNWGTCNWCAKARQFSAVIGSDAWGHDEKELAYAKARINNGDYI